MNIEPPDYTALELDVMRGGFALAFLYSLNTLRLFRPKGDLSRPVGVGRWLDLGWVPAKRRFLALGAHVAVLAYVLNRATPWALLYLAVFMVLQVTHASSEGSVNHGHHLVTVVAIVQLAAVALWNANARWDWNLGDWLGGSQGATLVWWSVQAMIGVYFTSGVTKLLHTGGGWIHQSPGLLVAATSRLETGGGMRTTAQQEGVPQAQQLIDVLVPRPSITRLLFGAGLLIELSAPLGFLGENALLVVGIALIALHQANGRLMLLPFPTYQILVLAYLVNVPRFWA